MADPDSAKGLSRAAKKRAKKKQKKERSKREGEKVIDELKEPTVEKEQTGSKNKKRARSEEESDSKDVASLFKKVQWKTRNDEENDDFSVENGGKKLAPCAPTAVKRPNVHVEKLLQLLLLDDNLEESVEKLTTRQRAVAAMHFMVQPSVSAEQFYRDYWEKQPFCIQAKSAAHRQRFDGFLSLASIRSMVESEMVYYGKDLNVTRYETDHHGVKRRSTLDLQLANKSSKKKQAPTSVDDDLVRVDSDILWDQYHQGCTVRLLCPHKHADAVHALLSLLEVELGCMVGANAYLTPPGASQGFAPHYDDIEAFCLQLEGRKRWKVYAPLNANERLPRVSSEDYTENDLKDVEPVMDVVLEPGDMLYMPRGWIHQACTLPSETEHSLHLTVSAMQQWAWADLMELLIPGALEAAIAGDNTALRAGLPRDFLDYMGAVHDSSDDTIPDFLKKKEASLMDEEEAEFLQELAQKQRQREDFRAQAKKRIARVAKEAIDMLDAACDQIGKRFMSDRLPPAWTNEERQSTCQGRKEALSVLPNMLCRLARQGIARLVLEDGKAVVYHCADNSRVFQEHPLSPMEFELDDAPAIEQLLTTVEPHWICVNDLIHDSVEDKVGVTQALFDEGILALRE